jgi:hypothetical protein
MAIATVNSSLTKLLTGPHGSRMVGGFVVALNASVKSGAARMLNSNDVALGVVMRALGTLVDPGAVDGGLVEH